jgi:hypothetical protein
MISTSITCGKKPLSQTAKSILDQTPHSKIINLGVMNKHQNSVSGISQRQNDAQDAGKKRIVCREMQSAWNSERKKKLT